jgi:phospholipid/cholesterol/gamma-HCH transport system substrate-binding protein
LKISNETKVGALTAIAITFLILGFNYMANEGDMFKSKAYYVAVYNQAPGINKGQKVLLNGYKIGYIHSVAYEQSIDKVIVVLKITENLTVPQGSTAQIISEDILGSRAIKLILNKDANKYLQSWDTLKTSIEISKLDELSRTVDPMVHRIEDMIEYVDSVLLRTGQLQSTIQKTTQTIQSIQNVANRTDKLMADNAQSLKETIINLRRISSEIAQNKDKIGNTLHQIETFSSSLNENGISDKLNNVSDNLEEITAKLLMSNNSAGKLLDDNAALYDTLLSTIQEVQILVADLHNFPDKYLPMPWGKKQRKKAIEASAKQRNN